MFIQFETKKHLMKHNMVHLEEIIEVVLETEIVDGITTIGCNIRYTVKNIDLRRWLHWCHCNDAEIRISN